MAEIASPPVDHVERWALSCPEETLRILDEIQSGTSQEWEEYRAWLKETIGVDVASKDWPEQHAVGAVSLVKLPSSPKEAFGHRPCTVAGICRKWSSLSVAQCWREWDMFEVCCIAGSSNRGFIKGHHRIAAVHLGMYCFYKFQGGQVPAWLLAMVRDIKIFHCGELSREDMVAKGFAKTAALSSAIELSWLDVCRTIVSLYPDRDETKLREKVRTHYAEVVGQVADWTSISKFIHRVPVSFFTFLDEWMQSRGLVLVPLPMTWLRDGKVLLHGERKRDGLESEGEFFLMIKRWLTKMEELSQQLKLDMNVKKELLALQRRDELCQEQRIKMKTIVQKWSAGLQALVAQHGPIFSDLDAKFLCGAFDNVVWNTMSPATGAFCWSFVRDFLSAKMANQARESATELEALAAAKAAEASALEDRAMHDKKAAMLESWRARVKGYHCTLQSQLPQLQGPAQELTSGKAEREAQKRAAERGSLCRVASTGSEKMEQELQSLSSSGSVLVVLDAYQEKLTAEMVQMHMRCIEPTGAVAVIIPAALGGFAIQAEQAISACVAHGACRINLHCTLPGAHATVSLLMAHDSFQSAQAASPLLGSILASPTLASGVLTFSSHDSRCLELVKAFKFAGCWVAHIDSKGTQCLNIAKALLPTVKLCFFTEKTSLSDALAQLEADVCAKQRRKLMAQPSNTTAELDKLAKQLPRAPDLQDEDLLQDLNLSSPGKFQPHVHLDASDLKPVPSQFSLAETLLPDALVLARDAVSTGLVVAPSLAVRGEMGLYSSKTFEKGEVVLVPRQAWAPLSSLADLSGKGYALVQPVILDQLGRTRLFALEGDRSRDLWCAINSTVGSRNRAPNVGVERMAGEEFIRFVALHQISGGDEILWSYQLEPKAAVGKPANIAGASPEETMQKSRKKLRRAGEEALAEAHLDQKPAPKGPFEDLMSKSQEKVTPKKRPPLPQDQGSSEKSVVPAKKQKADLNEGGTQELEEELESLFDEAMPAESSKAGRSQDKVVDNAETEDDAGGEDLGGKEEEGEEKDDDKATVAPSAVPEKAQLVKTFDEAELFHCDTQLYLKSKKGIKRKTCNIPILFECQGKVKRCREADPEPDLSWDVDKNTKVLFSKKVMSVGDLMKTQEVDKIFGYKMDKKKKIKGVQQDVDGNDIWYGFDPAAKDAEIVISGNCCSKARVVWMVEVLEKELTPVGCAIVSDKRLAMSKTGEPI